MLHKLVDEFQRACLDLELLTTVEQMHQLTKFVHVSRDYLKRRANPVEILKYDVVVSEGPSLDTITVQIKNTQQSFKLPRACFMGQSLTRKEVLGQLFVGLELSDTPGKYPYVVSKVGVKLS